MTLGNMRQNGVRHLDVSCWQCQHGALLDVEGYADDASPVVRTLPRQRTSLWPAAMSALGLGCVKTLLHDADRRD
jgi:hypothetical protein